MIVYISSAYYHELAHARIFVIYDVRPKIKFVGIAWITQGNEDDMNNLSHDEYMDMMKLHLLNEIVGYNLLFVTVPMMFLLFVIIVELWDVQEVLENEHNHKKKG